MTQWYDAFMRDPNQAVADLFSGRGGVGSSLRLDIPELLYQEFPDTPEFSQPRQALDNALWHWLSAMRRDYAAQVKRLGYGVYSKRLCDALVSVQLLDLPISAYNLREMLSSWLNWLTPLRLAPERDPALEYWRVLTHRQAENASPAPWLQLAADPRPEYLSVALVGLQRLPNNHDAERNQQTQLLALLQHAVLLPDSGQAYRFFNRHYAALRAIYPAGPEHWQTLLDTVSDAFKAKTTIAKDLLEKLREPTKPGRRQHTVSTFSIQPADKIETDTLSNDINKRQQSAEILAQRLLTILDKNYSYAQVTGDSHFFVRTLSNHGSRLLKRHSLSTDAMQRLQLMIERGLSLEPMDPFVWMLWAEYLASSEHSDARQWVLREAVRLFPNHESSRVELARLLMRQDQNEEAEHWLREAAERSPNAEHSRVELARLLMRQGHDEEAEHWLREVVTRSPNNEPSRVELARLLMRQGDDKEAEHWLREAVERSPNHEHSRVELARLLMRQGNDKEAEYWLREVVARSPNNEQSRVELARLLIRKGQDEEAEHWLREVVTRSPNNEPSRVVLAKLWVQQDKTSAAESLLTAFLKCCPQADQARKLLTMIQNGSIDLSSWLDFDAEDAIGHEARGSSNPGNNLQVSDNSAQARTSDERPDAFHSGILSELQRRALLQSEFNQAHSLDNIDKEAAQGDALACFYQQWLKPHETLNPPPHAWAAHACRLYQTQAPKTDWQQLNEIFPENRLVSRFLRLQTVDDEQETAALLTKLSSDVKAQTPLQQFIYQALKTDNPSDKDQLALAVLVSAAASPPQFASCF